MFQHMKCPFEMLDFPTRFHQEMCRLPVVLFLHD